MTCNKCGEKPKKGCGAFPKAVIEIDNPEKIVLLRKVLVPASMGDESTFPPTIGKYHNVLLEYEASGGIYLYSSDGIPTKLSSDVTELQAQLNALRVRIGEEEVARADADTALSDRITSLDNSLATVARTGSYNDLSDKPTIGNGTLTIKKNGSNVGTFTANATTNKSINIAVPTKTSDLTNDGSDGTSTYVETRNLPTVGNATLTITENNTSVGTFTANATSNKTINITSPTKTSDLTNDGADGTSAYVEADDLPTVDTTYSSSSNNAIANSTVTNSLDRNVMTDLAVDSTPSTTTVNLSNTKTNLAYPSSSTTSSISLPVASSTQAGVMNSATFDAVTSNTNNINAILNGAVAISNLPASPTQAQLTTAWENETGLTSLINRASVYDVTNNKVWTYYTNDQTWHAASNTSQVTVNTFTNSSEGTIKGSTNDGQVFAESDGTGSVNGWDTLTGNVANNTSKLATIAQGAEVNVQANWTQTNTSADDYIKNKPANLVQDANYVHTDNNFTTALKDKLNGISAGAEVNVQSDWSQTDTTADDYIKNKPTIPTVNNATLTIQKNGTNVQTFTANSSTNKTANITVPTAVSELTNDSGYATTTQLNNGLATKQDTLTAGDNIQINGNTISATDTTYTAGNAIDITNGEISADIHPADFFTAEGVVSDCGNDLSLDGTIASTLESVELKGDTFQQTYSGAQLLTKNGMATPYTDSDYWSLTAGASNTNLGDGWGRWVHTGTSIWVNVMPQMSSAISGGTYKTSTVYTILFEWKNVSNFDRLTISQPGNAQDPFDGEEATVGISLSQASGTSKIALTTKSTLTDSMRALRLFFTKHTASSDASIDMRVTIVEGDYSSSDLQWQPYVGGIPAPNPDYPQDVRVVTGEQTISVVGKNLFPTVSQTSSSTGITIARNSDGTYNISGTATSEFNAISWVEDLSAFADGQTYTLSVSEQVGDLLVLVDMYHDNTWLRSFPRPGGTTLSRTATLNLNNATKIKFSLRVQSGKTVNLTNLAVQFERGTATAYEPYQPQSYKINLGKNLFDKYDVSAQLPNTYINTTGVLQAGTNAGTVFAKCQPNATYTVSKSLSARFIIGETATLPADGVAVSNIIRDDTATHLTITTGPTAQYIVVFCHHSSDTMTLAEIAATVQIEAGSVATEYAPYFPPIELCKIDDYQDEIFNNDPNEDWYDPDLEDNAWYVHKEIGKLDMSTITGWGKNANGRFYRQSFVGSYGISGNQLYSNIFLYDTTAWASDGKIGIAANNNFWMTTGDSTLTSASDVPQWLEDRGAVLYGALVQPTNTKITDAALVAQLNALAEAKSYNDQTNIIVTTAGDNLPATLCVEAYRKSLEGVIEAIDSACTCRKNLVVYLPNGMTTYTNNDAPIPISEVLEALKRGQSVFLVDGGLSESVYTVTAANMDDGIYSMRADQTGIDPRGSDGHWHINGGGDVWTSVTFINDATPSTYSPNIYEKTWFAFTSSTPLLNQYRRTYYPASSDMTFNNNYGNLSVAELWEKLASSAWNGNPVVLEVPLQDISTRTTSLVDNGFSAESPYLTISVSLGPDSYFERETSEYTITGWAAECTTITFGGKEAYAAGIVRVVENGNTTYSFVVTLTEVKNPIN